MNMYSGTQCNIMNNNPQFVPLTNKALCGQWLYNIYVYHVYTVNTIILLYCLYIQ